ncbi:MAG: hypothetical protein J0I34_27275 [Pseudonocardia sp.]|uniref:hypothetical protein n=1 Tax=unclassified Pseudonocardia TaxID=2619320 RepID=UPI00086AD462|nr:MULTISPECIES: hypothetical protein [unclassified Pseudonocardia]MBN9112476.1 hypothetical protein [Pseudonocardia sp.]ODU27265.1 MAG: hypothetical protein ABS80_03705 [Pseudonocardia sp. SCN 72-51]ODV08879.1 MAG: hypothetical protein ABT15_01095 [Pseudonocardia sp. SCN 73-27]
MTLRTALVLRGSRVFGGLMIGGAGLNTALLAAAPESYAALGAWLDGPAALRRLWAGTMSAHPYVWVPLVGIGFEFGIGILALARRPRRRLVGLLGIALFHVGLLVMGLWWWALPVLALLMPLLVGTWRDIDLHRSPSDAVTGAVG